MKRVIFVRHAKSSWTHPDLADHDRPLNPRGVRDAPRVAQELHRRYPAVDAMYVSTAQRTRETAAFFAEACKVSEEHIYYRSDLYIPDVDDVMDVISLVDDRYDNIVVFGHNPCWTMLANKYSKTFVANVPTCGVFVVDYDMVEWSSIHQRRGEMLDFWYPKMLSI